MKQKNPKISVIVPVYNVADYLKLCLNSFKKQTFKDFEVIAVDDGSTDDSGKILDIFQIQESWLKTIHQKNQGVSMARNEGLKKAKGEYIVFVDPDDEIHPEFLDSLYSLIWETKSDMVACDCVIGKTIKNWKIETAFPPYATTTSFDDFVLGKLKLFYTVWGKMYQKKLLKDLEFLPQISCAGEDLLYLYQVLYRTKKLIYLPMPLYFYRQRPNSVMTSPLNKRFVLGNIKLSVLLQDFINHHPMSQKVYQNLTKNNTKRLFKFGISEPARTKEKEQFFTLTRPLLLALHRSEYYHPKLLKWKYRVWSWWFLRKK